eukprot:4302634-Amphidinium_carterae.1
MVPVASTTSRVSKLPISPCCLSHPICLGPKIGTRAFHVTSTEDPSHSEVELCVKLQDILTRP